jgi:tRNA uridine 5-carbamoylmethylation protein Kti12
MFKIMFHSAGKSTFAASLLAQLLACPATSPDTGPWDEGPSASPPIRISFDDYEFDKEQWDAQSYKISRERALSAVQLALVERRGCAGDAVVVVDDTMHLRSMRRQMYAIARDNGFMTLVVWVKVSLRTLWRTSPRPLSPCSPSRWPSAFM